MTILILNNCNYIYTPLNNRNHLDSPFPSLSKLPSPIRLSVRSSSSDSITDQMLNGNSLSNIGALHSTSLNIWTPKLKISESLGYTTDMESSVSQSLYPLHRCKTIHLVRHAQGIHNVAGEKNHDSYMSEDYFDAHLTPLGWEQVENLRKHVHSIGLSKKVELVIVSPLLRTMQTAVGVFGGEGYSNGIDVSLLMVENVGNSTHPAISSLNCSPFIAVELCREHLGVHPCDRRRSVSEYKSLFPAIDFSLIESDLDVLWEPNVREKDEAVAARGMKFLNWLWTRKEKEIAVVTHSGWLYHTLSAFGNDCHSSIKAEICSHFKNCELRSVVIVDRSMIGSDTSTDYPGKIPSGADFPSD